MTEQSRTGRAYGADSPAGLPEAYRRWRRSRLGQITDELEERRLLELIGPVEGRRVLDIGCGDGVLATKLAHRGADVTGLDLDTEMLEAARCRASRESVHLELVHGRSETLPFASKSFDCVVAVTVLCFVEQPVSLAATLFSRFDACFARWTNIGAVFLTVAATKRNMGRVCDKNVTG